MTIPTPLRPTAPAAPATVTVAVLGPAAPPAATLAAALTAVRLPRVRWRVVAGDEARETVHVVVCDLASAGTAAGRWPTAAVVALVPPRHRQPEPELAGVLCLADGDIGLVAAYVQSIARRRGLLGREPGR